MKIKDYVCKCGKDQFFFGEKNSNNSIGIYCESCGRWLKWADKNERNLKLLQDKNERNLKLLQDKEGMV